MNPVVSRSRAIVAILCLTAALVGCPQSGGTSNASVATVTVTPNNPSLKVGGTISLAAVARDAAGNPVNGVSFVWSSSKPEIASVTQTGKVTALAVGISDVSVRSTPGDKLSGVEVSVTGGAGNPPPPPPGGGGTLSGTVTAPTGKSVSGTTVAACFIENGGCNADSANSQFVEITQAGSSAPFSFTGLAAGQYGLLAIKDANANGTLDAGDYTGCHISIGNCVALTPPGTGKNIPMEVYAGGTSAGSRDAARVMWLRDSRR
jgi:Bacterial Ig-like domain (group 2)/Uncharacterized protein conserved in bacteria (DUF2141)